MGRSAAGNGFAWLAPGLAAAAFVVLLVAFYASVVAYRVSIDRDARRDLEARTELAAMTLSEPLRTQDFAAVHSFGDSCRIRGYELSVRTRAGGLIFDTRTKADASASNWVGASVSRGEYTVELLRPRDEVFAPFRRTYRLFVLAALLGAAGMLFLFVAFYRQRVRIRELSRLEEFRREFVADVSHEIKTPLTGILGAAEMLSDGGADAEAQKPLLAMISKESKRLNALVQQILDLARLEREGEALDLADVDLTEMVREVAERYGVATGRVVGADGSHDVVVADARLVGEAVSNLVENAKRHSGTDDITVSLERDGVERIVVEDHGIGIPPEHAARVFERFHRVDPARAAESGGAGLGLAIVRRIARLHGGDVALAPAAPHGCRFTLSIPL